MIPKSVKLSINKKSIQIEYENNNYLVLRSSFLRRYSPSAENKHNKDRLRPQDIRSSGVLINKIEAVGNYAVRVIFDDGHNTGIFSWEYLYKIGTKAQNSLDP